MPDEKKEIKEEVVEEIKEKKVKVKYINQKCGLKVSPGLKFDRKNLLEFKPNDVKAVSVEVATMLLTDFYDQFEGADSAAKKIDEAAMAHVRKVQAKNAAKAKAAAAKKK